MKNKERKYTAPDQYFHNYEHDPDGRTHCRGPLNNPYRIVHYKGKHIISTKAAKGHGIRREPTWFVFTKRFGPGFLLSSGKISGSKDISSIEKTKQYFSIDDKEHIKMLHQMRPDHDKILDRIKNLPPLKVGTKNFIAAMVKKYE